MGWPTRSTTHAAATEDSATGVTRRSDSSRATPSRVAEVQSGSPDRGLNVRIADSVNDIERLAESYDAAVRGVQASASPHNSVELPDIIEQPTARPLREHIGRRIAEESADWFDRQVEIAARRYAGYTYTQCRQELIRTLSASLTYSKMYGLPLYIGRLDDWFLSWGFTPEFVALTGMSRHSPLTNKTLNKWPFVTKQMLQTDSYVFLATAAVLKRGIRPSVVLDKLLFRYGKVLLGAFKWAIARVITGIARGLAGKQLTKKIEAWAAKAAARQAAKAATAAAAGALTVVPEPTVSKAGAAIGWVIHGAFVALDAYLLWDLVDDLWSGKAEIVKAIADIFYPLEGQVE